MLIQESACRIYLGVLLDVGQNHVKDLSNTLRVCTVEEVSQSLLWHCFVYDLYINSNAEAWCSCVSHCGQVFELVLTTSNHTTDRLEQRETGRRDERNIMKNWVNAGTALTSTPCAPEIKHLRAILSLVFFY